MKSMIRNLAVVSSACLLVAATPDDRELPSVEDQPAPGQNEDDRPAELRTQMETLERAYQEAYNRHDAQALARLYAEEAILVTPDGRELRGRSSIASYYEELFPQMSPRLTFQDVETGGRGDLGWAYGNFTIEMRGPAQQGRQAQEQGQRGQGQQAAGMQPIEGHYVVITQHAAGRGQIKLQVAHPGESPITAPGTERPTPPAAPGRP
jgi:ketosteroid isomerase-like protein